MIWEIWSIGDSAYLAAILNAVAMVSGTQDIRTLAAVGFLLGLILVAFQGALQGAQGIKFQNVLIAWIVYAGLFGTTARVTIEDAYTGQVRVVDNVPLGPAFVGSVMSTVGYKLTVLFEQVFTTPAMTSGGFADPLQTLATVRKSMMSTMSLARANSPSPGSDAQRTFANYFDECVLREVDAGGRSFDDMKSASEWTAFAVNSNIWTTEILVGGAPQTLSCRDAWARIRAFTTDRFLPALQKNLQAALRLQSPDEVPNRVQTALNTLSNEAVDAQNYMVMSALLPFFDQGVVQVYDNMQKYSAATMEQQAIDQRNAQWAAEKSLFTRIVRPMMTFFEGFIFAITPLMAFAVALGPSGIMMVGKWLLFGLWIQLWMPVLAIINLYINMAAQRDMAAISAVADVPISSFYGIMKADVLIQDYLATGGMLAASTPAISLMLIYGSAITATHLAGRLKGSDHVDEKQMSPDAVKTASGLQVSPLMDRTPTAGTTMHDAAQMLPSFSVSQATQADLSSKAAYQAQAVESFGKTLGATAEKSLGHRIDGGSHHTMSESWKAGTSQTDSFFKKQAGSIAEGHSLTASESDALGAAVAAGVSARLGGQGEAGVQAAVRQQVGRAGATTSAGGGVSAGVAVDASGKLSQNAEDRTQMLTTLALQGSREIARDSGQRAELARSMDADAKVGESNIYTDGLSKGERAQVERSARDAITATREYQEAQSASARVGAETRLSAPVAGKLVAESPEAWRDLQATEALHPTLRGSIEQTANSYQYARGMADPQQRHAAAALAVLMGKAETTTPRTPQERAAMEAAGNRILGKVAGGVAVPHVDPREQQGLQRESPQSGEGQGAFAAWNPRDPTASASRLPEGAQAGRDATRRVLTGEDPLSVQRGAQDRVGARATVNSGGVHGRWAEEKATQDAEKRGTFDRLIRQRAGQSRTLARWGLEEAGGFLRGLSDAGASVSDFAGRAMAAGDRFATALMDTGSLGAAMAAGNREFREAVGKGAALREEQLRGQYHLTDEQVGLYKAAVGQALFPVDAKAANELFGTDVAQAREALVKKEGPIGDDMAALILRAATSRDDSAFNLLKGYNDANRGGEDGNPNGGPGGPETGAVFRTPGERQYGPTIVAAAREHGVPPALALAMVREESSFNPDARSNAGAIGLMQLMPGTAARYGVRDIHDPEQNIRGGVAYLRDLGERFNNDQNLVIAAYNAGEGAVAKYGNQVPPYPETIGHVAKVSRSREMYERRLG